jgi:hypothetical protein
MADAIHRSAALHADTHRAERTTWFAGDRLANGNSRMQYRGSNCGALCSGDGPAVDIELNVGFGGFCGR